jgi:hypothetical protein
MMNGINMLPDAIFAAATAFVALGAYYAIEPMAWGRLNITGNNGWINRAAAMLPGSNNVKGDLGDLATAGLSIATIGGLAYIASDKKALNLVDRKVATNAVYLSAILLGANFLKGMRTAGIGNVATALVQGEWALARNSFMAGGLGNTHHNLNVALPPPSGNMAMGGAHNYALQQTMQTANTAAIQRGTGTSGFFGTRGGLGSARVNLF